MPGRRNRNADGALRARPPMQLCAPASLDLATIGDHHLEDEATYRRLEFVRMDLTGRMAESVAFEQCRLRGNVDLGGTTLGRAMFTDCLIENSNLANLRVEKAGLVRVLLSVLRMTGVHWIVYRTLALPELRPSTHCPVWI